MPRMGGYVPADHKTRHEDGGRDEISIASLSGEPATLTTHKDLASGIHGVGSGDLVGTGLTQTLTAKTLTSPTIQGTVDPGTGLTLPAFTGGGDITFGLNAILLSSARIAQIDTNIAGVTNLANNDMVDWRAGIYQVDDYIIAMFDGVYLTAKDEDAHFWAFKARDTGLGLVELARLVGAADPYFQMTLAMRLKPIATASLPATPVEGMLVYDDTANKLKVYNGSAWETVTSAS